MFQWLYVTFTSTHAGVYYHFQYGTVVGKQEKTTVPVEE
jgi:hypothetical protein